MTYRAGLRGVITDDEELHQLSGRIEHHACDLLALQAPIASSPRTVVGAIRAGQRLEYGRSGPARRRDRPVTPPYPDVPTNLADRFAEMGRLAMRACLDLEPPTR